MGSSPDPESFAQFKSIILPLGEFVKQLSTIVVFFPTFFPVFDKREAEEPIDSSAFYEKQLKTEDFPPFVILSEA